MESDLKRYKKYYNLNPNYKGNFDIVLDTSELDIEGVCNKIIEFLENQKNL